MVISRVNVEIPSPDGTQRVLLRRGVMENPPAWALETPYARALIADGKLMVTAGKTESAIADALEAPAAAEKPKRGRGGQK